MNSTEEQLNRSHVKLCEWRGAEGILKHVKKQQERLSPAEMGRHSVHLMKCSKVCLFVDHYGSLNCICIYFYQL